MNPIQMQIKAFTNPNMNLQLGLPSLAIPHASIQRNVLTINIRTRRRRQVNHYTSNVLRLTQPLPWIPVLELLLTSQDLDKTVREFRREEAGSYGVGCNVTGSQLDCELAREMMCCSLGYTVHNGAMLADVRDCGTCDGADNDDA